MKQAIIIVLVLISAAMTMSQTTSRRSLKPIKTPTPSLADTIAADTASFRIFGYEKALRSTTESFFVQNLTPDTISRIIVEVEYMTMKGSQLHRRTISRAIVLPPGQTRQVSCPSWDRQQVWYYYQSPSPRNTTQATPYRVAISIRSYVRPRKGPL